MSERLVLTDQLLRAAAKAPSDKRFDLLDALVPGLLAVVHPSGNITLQLRTRIGARTPIRRAIGKHGQVTVQQARTIARRWIELLHSGGDPKAEQRKQREAAARAAAATVGVVFAQFEARKLRHQRRGQAVAAAIRRDLLPAWHDRPLAELDHRDVRDAIERAAARGTSGTYAHNLLDATRALFAYGLERDLIEHNPCDRIRRQSVIGRKVARERVLSDDELRALGRAAARLPYPWGPLYQLLLLTGARLNEVAGARWGEVDLARKLFTVPAARFKTGQQHQIPLTEDVLALLATLPRFRSGDCVFSCEFGERATPTRMRSARRWRNGRRRCAPSSRRREATW